MLLVRFRVAIVLGLSLSLTAAGLGLPVPAWGAPPSTQETLGEQIEVNVVNVEVYVTDREGRPVTGLQRKDFTILEDGKPMEALNFEAVAGQPGPAADAAPATQNPQAAAPAHPEAAPAGDGQHLAVFIDNTFLHPAHRNRAVGQIREFLATGLAPGDKVMVVTQDPGLHVRLPFTTDRAALEAALSGVESLAAPGLQLENERKRALDLLMMIREANSRGPDPNPCDPEIAIPVTTYAEATRQEVLRSINTMTVLVNSLAGIRGRKALLHVSDGLPLNPGEELFEVLRTLCGGGGATAGLAGVTDADGEAVRGSSYQGSQAGLDALKFTTAGEFTSLAAHANAQRVTFYTLQASGLSGNASADAGFGPGERILQLPTVATIQSANLRDSLSLLASETGGRTIFDANDLRPDLARIQQDFGSYYSLGYSPPHVGDGRQHRIEVRVKQPGMRVRHRQTYRDKPLLERAADRTLAALFHGTEENPLQVELAIGEIRPAEGKTFSVPLRLRIPLFKLFLRDNQKALVGKVRLLVATQGAGGETSRVRQIEIPIQIARDKALIALGKNFQYDLTLTLTAGDQRIAVAVQDTSTAQASYLARDLKVGGEVEGR